MPNKKKTKKASTRSRRSPTKREIVVEERTRVIPSTRVVAVRRDPVTFSRALGQAAVVDALPEPPAITETTIVRRRKRL
jgi:hypothetical protein